METNKLVAEKLQSCIDKWQTNILFLFHGFTIDIVWYILVIVLWLMQMFINSLCRK